MPDDDLTFAELFVFVGAARKTVLRVVRELGITPRRRGNTTFYTRAQAARVAKYHARYGGRWPSQAREPSEAIR